MDKNQTGSHGVLEFSTFYLGDALLGINILDIQEINKQFEITRVPKVFEYIESILDIDEVLKD